MNEASNLQRATAFAPGSIGNVAIGFDILGLAVDALGDRITVSRRAKPGVGITAIRGVAKDLPLEAERNTAGRALLAMQEALNPGFGFEMEIEKGIPLGSGLGGSAASAMYSRMSKARSADLTEALALGFIINISFHTRTNLTARSRAVQPRSSPMESPAMTDAADRVEIRELIENWVVWRDAGDWERFATVWHDDGWMQATWFQGPASDFIRVSKEGWAKGVSILHFQGGISIDLAGARAIAQTKMTISQRGPVHGVVCDVVCTGRFFDFLEKRGGRWGLVRRQPIYEKDRLDPVDPVARLELDRPTLAQYPDGYRHLAYIQEQIGYRVKRDMPGLKGAEVEKLYGEGRAWLAG